MIRYGNDVPLLLRLIGCRETGREYRFNWGSFEPRFGLALGVGCSPADDSDGRASLYFTAGWGKFFIKLWRGSAWQHDDMWESYSFSLDPDCHSSIHLNWGKRCKIVDLPWEWRQVRHEVQRRDGSWTPLLPHYGTRANDWQPRDDGRHKTAHEYTYKLRNGGVQHVIATIYVERREWRWKAFKWLPFPRMRCQAIDVNFNAEVGERAGSWKGGCIGCSYEMKPGETPEDTLRRMERERTFR